MQTAQSITATPRPNRAIESTRRILHTGSDDKRPNADLLQELGAGQSVVFSHGWPLTADAFVDQMAFLASHGYHARRLQGHPRLHQDLLRNRLHRRPQEVRCAYSDPARRRRLGRAHRCSCPSLGKIVKGARLKFYPGAPHRMCSILKDEINVDILAFLKE
jgi:hypothetical protein